VKSAWIPQGVTLSKTVRSAGVGLLASLITLAANLHLPGLVFGSEYPLEVSLSGRLSEKSAWDASSNSGDISDNSLDSVLGTPLNISCVVMLLQPHATSLCTLGFRNRTELM